LIQKGEKPNITLNQGAFQNSGVYHKGTTIEPLNKVIQGDEVKDQYGYLYETSKLIDKNVVSQRRYGDSFNEWKKHEENFMKRL